jgi:hypothetical protein
MHALPASLLLLLAVPLASCVEPTQVRLGGAYRATLQSQGGEGGAIIQLVGPGIEEVAGPPGTVVATYTAADTVRVLILAEPRRTAALPGISFHLTMAGGMGVPRASVLEVVDGNSQLRPFAESYHVHFSREDASR